VVLELKEILFEEDQSLATQNPIVFKGPVRSLFGFIAGDGRVVIDADGAIYRPDGSLLIDAEGCLHLNKTSTPPRNAKPMSGQLVVPPSVCDGDLIQIGDTIYEVDSDDHTETGHIPVSVKDSLKAQAQGIFTLTDVVKPGEQVVIGEETYVFQAQGEAGDTDIPVDVSAFCAAAQATLSIGETLSGGIVIQIGDDNYEILPSGRSQDGNITVIASDMRQNTVIAALIAAIMAAGSEPVIAYPGGNTNEVVVEYAVCGTIGNGLAVSVTGEGITWDVTALEGGTDVPASDALDTLKAVIDAESQYDFDSQVTELSLILSCTAAGNVDGSLGNLSTNTDCEFGSWNAFSGGGDGTAEDFIAAFLTAAEEDPAVVCDQIIEEDEPVMAILVTAKELGPQEIVTTSTLAMGGFAEETLKAGSNGTPAVAGACMFDDDYLYIAIDDNDLHDAHWRRFSLGAAY
jgi:hypothetical protein